MSPFQSSASSTGRQQFADPVNGSSAKPLLRAQRTGFFPQYRTSAPGASGGVPVPGHSAGEIISSPSFAAVMRPLPARKGCGSMRVWRDQRSTSTAGPPHPPGRGTRYRRIHLPCNCLHPDIVCRISQQADTGRVSGKRYARKRIDRRYSCIYEISSMRIWWSFFRAEALNAPVRQTKVHIVLP
jgi:hypothetical protein